MNRYKYDGPVMEFDICIANNWKGETMAASESKARSNLTYQFKCHSGLEAFTKIRLPGKITMVK